MRYWLLVASLYSSLSYAGDLGGVWRVDHQSVSVAILATEMDEETILHQVGAIAPHVPRLLIMVSDRHDPYILTSRLREIFPGLAVTIKVIND